MKVQFTSVSNIVAPKGSPMAGTYFKEISSTPEVREIKLSFFPCLRLPKILIPEGFPLDITGLIPLFFEHRIKGDSVESFFEKKGTKSSKVTGVLTSDIFVEGDEKNVIGQKVLTPCLSVPDFFRELERHLKTVQAQGFWALFEKNLPLMKVMASILREEDSPDTEFFNIREIARFFSETGNGRLEEKVNDFYFTVGSDCLRVTTDDPLQDILDKT